jgi:putrescine transport system substrate-binding protein
MRKRSWIGVLTAALMLTGPAVAQDKVVNVYNWTDYIDPTVLEDFTKETGIKVVYDTMDSNEVLETKLLAGKTGYDVVVPSATFLQRQIKAGVFQKLDKSKLPNLKNMWPEVMTQMAVYDPGNEHAVNYMWFTTGISYNVNKVKERIGDQPINSWDIVFKPENIAKFKDCGVYFLDSPEDIISAALKFLGKDPGSKDPKDIEAAGKLLGTVRPYVKKFNSSEYINALANGDICLAIGWAGDTFQARDRAIEAKNGVEINYAIPKEGTLMSMDTLAVPADAPHVAEAHAFIDYMMRPDVAAKNVNVTKFASGVLAAKPLVAKEILDNPSIYPPDATLKNLYTVLPYDAKSQRVVTRVWTRLKTGQ